MDAASFTAAWNTRTNMIFLTLVVLSALAVAAASRRAFRGSESIGYEGFALDLAPRFVAKHNNDVYDAFYAGEYAAINIPDRHIDVLLATLGSAGANPESSIVLDIGSGTGTIAAELLTRGFAISGIDNSPHMADYSAAKFPDLHVERDDVQRTMVYEKQSFSHILCLDMTIYEIPDIARFFSNCYFWLKLNGRMILHLADPNKYDLIPAAAKQGFIGDQIQTAARERITDTTIEFPEYVYTRTFSFATPGTISSQSTMTETFTDKGASGVARRYQSTLYLDSLDHILDTATRAGFTLRGQMRGARGDPHQYFFVLERLM
jgi:SAM-dependent methyltransferase